MINALENLVVYDTESYPNYWLIAFKSLDTGKVVSFEIRGAEATLTKQQVQKIRSIMTRRVTFGFNSRNYDLPVLLFALRGASASLIHRFGSHIIENNVFGWQSMKEHNLSKPPQWAHFDVQEPAPGVRVSLKLYGGRMHSKRLQDLPYEPGSTLTPEMMDEVSSYCVNDLDTTIELFEKIRPQMQLRVDMGKRYNQDLMTKSDAQIAEAVLKAEIAKRNPRARLKAPKISKDARYRYKAPPWISFEDQTLQSALAFIKGHRFELDAKGSIKLPDELRKLKITLGSTHYQLGVGGLHSKEKAQSITPAPGQKLLDKDVASYYPSIIMGLGLAPEHLGESFLEVYKGIVEERLAAKKSGNKVVNESLKVTINGSYGKLGSKYSVLYAPNLLVAVTLTGQLALLMLIEQLEKHGISVVSANTDGFVSLVNDDQYSVYDTLCLDWELLTGYELEENEYLALHSKDVNNYLAVTPYGYKAKGIFKTDPLTKNPAASICATAARQYLIDRTPIEDSVLGCDDVTQFLHVRTVNGGAVYRNQYLGKVVRWLYVQDGHPIEYKRNGNKVPKSDSSIPMMQLAEIPTNLDYVRYIEEAEQILAKVGVA